MLGWSLFFFLLAAFAGWLGFFGLAGFSAAIAQVLFFIFLALVVVGFVVKAVRGESVV